ncbi:hypothetical protein CKF94_06835 [Vibrio coralliilyticus]|uniref:DUF262 domain-containing protein n=1 Tax=Vibrio coralliilyticus TaxID=190893 RepID=UPI000BAAB062|nr:DUF262 domain-containing protein [Vibrio coralliilyticus]PAU39099.1 hypothetical protein CKF94_06835 [Vibrio coralliilyticus]
MSEPITIKKLIERISSGDIRIPAFQRNYVWEPDQVAFLLDSIYKEFPIGTIILWKTDKRLSVEKKLGFFELPEPQKDYPVNYVLDGQQRITSLFSVFQTDLTPTSDEWVDVYFDLHAEDNVQESIFLALDGSEVNKERHFPVKTFFDSVKYRKATDDLPDELKVKLDNVQDKFRTYMIPNEVFESDDRNSVAIVFERINRAGTELNIFELLSAWSWSDQFDLVEKFDALQEKIIEHGFDELCNDRDLQLRICAGIITGEATPNKILSLQGEEIRNRFTEIENGIIGALDFLSRELNVKHYKMLPFPGLLVPLSAFFATVRKDGQPYSSKQKEVIVRWFWRSIFTRRFSAGVNERQATDISNLLSLKANENHDFKLPKQEVKFDFSKTNFSPASANSKSLILLLNTCAPQSLLSGANIDLSKVLKKGSKHEYHHIYPNKFLERSGKERKEINVLANICFLTRTDNNLIKDKDPSIYSLEIAEKNRPEYLASSLLPADFGQHDYDKFLEKRTKILMDRAFELMS